jgi:hypothetical protein
MTQKTKVPDMAYSVCGDIVEIEQSTGCGEFTLVELHKVHIKLIAEEMRITEPTPATMNEIVKMELMELLESIRELWGDIGDKSYTDLTMLTDAKNLHQKALSICRIAGCKVGDGNNDSVTSALATVCKQDSMSAHNELSEPSVSNQHSLLEA